ncbi:MAG: CC0125/CC1285 family lipoprotein [Planctomycetota bacterium]|jgi:hypothetical protein
MRRFEAVFFALAGLTFTCGCQPTPYQKLGTTPAGGYSDKRFSENEFHVRFVANNNTPSRAVCGYLYRRAAELALENGFRYFAVIRGPRQLTERMVMYQSENHFKDMADPIEFEVADPGKLHMTIRCFEDAREECDMTLIDARAYLQKHVRHEVE